MRVCLFCNSPGVARGGEIAVGLTQFQRILISQNNGICIVCVLIIISKYLLYWEYHTHTQTRRKTIKIQGQIFRIYFSIISQTAES